MEELGARGAEDSATVWHRVSLLCAEKEPLYHILDAGGKSGSEEPTQALVGEQKRLWEPGVEWNKSHVV